MSMSHVQIEAAILLQYKILQVQNNLFLKFMATSSAQSAADWKKHIEESIQKNEAITPEVKESMIKQFDDFSKQTMVNLT